MAQISINNGRSNIDVDSLSHGQVLQACEIASGNDDEAFVEVDGQVHESDLAWLSAYCEAFERIYGVVWVAW